MLSIKKITTVTIIKILGALLSIVYYLLQIDYFGMGRTIECYFVAISLVAILLSLTQIGHLSSVFLPIYHAQKKKFGVANANRSFWVIVNWLLSLSILVIPISWLISDILVGLIAPGFDKISRDLISHLFKVLSFSIVLQILNIKFSILLNALNVFNRAEFLTIVKVGIGVITLYFGFNHLGIWSLILGIYLGHFIALLFFIKLLYSKGLYYQFVFSSKHFDHKSFFYNLIYIYPFIFSRRLYDIVLTASASFLPQGVYAIYKYIESIFLKTGGIILTPTTNIFFTNYSLSNIDQANKIFNKAFKINLVFSLFAILIIWSFGRDVIHFFWYQKIEPHFIELAYSILVISFISLLFAAIGGLCFRILFVKRKTKILYLTWATSFLLLSIYASTIIFYLKEIGLVSVILVNAILNNCLFLFLVYKENKTILRLLDRSFFRRVLSVFFVSLLLGFGIDQFDFSLGVNGRLNFLVKLVIKTTLLTIGVGVMSLIFKVKPKQINI